MNKKIIISSFLGASLLLTSCGTKQLGTFAEELKAEQDSYVKNVEKYFSGFEGFSSGKFDTDGKVKISGETRDFGNGSLSYDFKGKVISEKDKKAFDLDIGLDLKAQLAGNYFILPEELDKSEVSAKIKGKVGLVEKNFYFNLKDLGLDTKLTGKHEQVEKTIDEFKKLIEKVKPDLLNKWATIEMPESFYKEFLELGSKNIDAADKFKPILKMAVTGDYFVGGEKTTYAGVEAYKFSIDETKFKTNLKNIFKSTAKAVTGMDDKALEDDYAEIDKDIDKLKLGEVVGYLTRGKDNGANLIIEKLEIISKEEGKLTVSVSILEDEIKIQAIDERNSGIKISFKAASGGKISYSGAYLENNLEIVNISGNYKNNKSSTVLNTSFDLEAKLLKANVGSGEQAKTATEEGGKVKLELETNVKKNDSIAITKDSIVGKDKVLTQSEFEAILEKYFEGMIKVDNSAYGLEDDFSGDFDLDEAWTGDLDEASETNTGKTEVKN
ncbi:hypothetical protein D8B46_08435 [Candidatus Gracilibacteria bacterium]|nr:MAG: hypothetical protein D8B46_08435 [Candidatus Gracilibacteria bacterium]